MKTALDVKPPPLTVLERHKKILHWQRLSPYMPLPEMAKMLNVSEQTVRRDIKEINADGDEWGRDMAQGAFMRMCRDDLSDIEEILNLWKKDIDGARILSRMDKTNRKKPDYALETKYVKYKILKLEAADNIPMYHKFSHYAKLIENGKVQV